jgi:hypothetical protein
MPRAPAEVSWTIRQGRTFKYVLRPEMLPLIYKPITGIAQAAPISITATGHGLASGWSAAVTNVVGMTQINAVANALRESDFRPVSAVDANTITINAIDAAGFSSYVGGGSLVYYTPVPLAGATARLNLRDAVGGELLYEMSTTIGNIVLNDSTHTITLTIPAAATAAFTFLSAVGDLELVHSDSSVDELLRIEVAVVQEVTTTS